jgi:hypothetical protein
MSTRMSKEEREKAKRRAKLNDARRFRTEAEIARLTESGQLTTMSIEEIEDYLNIVFLKLPPDQEFLLQRLEGAGLTDFDDKFRLALVDLVASDLPLSAITRQLVANELRYLYLPEPQRSRAKKNGELRAQLDTANALKHHLMKERGMTATDADTAIEEAWGVSTDTLNTKRKRARRRGILGSKKP